jgi:aerobic-type carbon monoxide dehydrogenase small subunit (CoxS/CutS family)
MGNHDIKYDDHNEKKGISRRQFIRNMGITSVGTAAATSGVIEKLQGATFKPTDKIYGPGAQKAALSVNGRKFSVSVEPRMTLAEVLRDQLNLTGTKIGCDRGACGACTVIMAGKTVNACMTFAMDAIGHDIQTVEGLVSTNSELHAVQESFIQYDAMQCGFCTSGFLMSCKNLLDNNSNPSLQDAKLAVSGNLCRCGTYPKVFEAVVNTKG